MIRIVEPGWSTTVQDTGRHGLAHLGVPPSGTVDPGLAALVNRLVGNDPDAAVIETAGHLVIEAVRAAIVAVSTAPAPHAIAPRQRLRVEPDPDRTWAYLAVRGGFDTPVVLGSRSTDTLAGIAGVQIAAAVELPVGPDPGHPVTVDVAPVRNHRAVARVWPGPRVDWFAPGSFEALCTTPWVVSAEVSRVGLRLDGTADIVRRRHDELPSEGLVRGAIQVPPDGRPVVMAADHPTTGGYPVIAVVDPDDLALVTQQRSGREIRFVDARR